MKPRLNIKNSFLTDFYGSIHIDIESVRIENTREDDVETMVVMYDGIRKYKTVMSE